MLTPFFEARAWRIAIQVVAALPRISTLLESPFADGFYILHSVVPRAAGQTVRGFTHPITLITLRGVVLLLESMGAVEKSGLVLPADRPTAAQAPAGAGSATTGSPTARGE